MEKSRSTVNRYWMCRYEAVDKAVVANASMQPLRIVGTTYEGIGLPVEKSLPQRWRRMTKWTEESARIAG